MGWWRTDSGGVIGDAPADMLEDVEVALNGPDDIPEKVLTHIRFAYREAFERDPTQQELADLVDFCRGPKGG